MSPIIADQRRSEATPTATGPLASLDDAAFEHVVCDNVFAHNRHTDTRRQLRSAEFVQRGESAIELIRDGGAGIVLMDIHMPGMGGIEATRRIRAAHPDLMVLLMSTYDVEDLPAGAANCGAAAYLHKEHLSPDLLTRLWRTAH